VSGPVRDAAAVDWAARADAAYDALVARFWNRWLGLFRVSTGWRGWLPLGPWNYWWQAHALDCVLDAVARGRAGEADRAARLVHGVLRRNGGRIQNDYYDDMGWMALALDRAREVAGLDTEGLVRTLWVEIQGGWNAAHGGIVWRRGDTYTNTPANAPAAILALRRHRVTGDPLDLAWARRIAEWLHTALVERGTGVVWDGIHPGADPGPGRERYSYNHGTVAGADQMLFEATGDPGYRESALLVARAGLPGAGLPGAGVLPDEGGGDRALFKGIYARYVAGLADPDLTEALRRNGESAWRTRSRAGLSGPSWTRSPSGAVELSAHLSGVLLLGALAAT